MDLRNGDCLELMKTIPDKSIDLLLCDLPYGETNCNWDTKIDMEEFWNEFKRIRKSPKVACIHFCSTKFGYTLIKSWEKGYKMDLVWKKRNKTGGLQSRHRPMRNHEMMYFFYDQAPKYNRDKYHKRIKAYPSKKENGKDAFGNDNIGVTIKECGFASNFAPPNPASVVEEKTIYGVTKEEANSTNHTHTHAFEPPNPASVVEEDEEEQILNKNQIYGKACGGKGFNNKEFRDKLKEDGFKMGYTPAQPGSIVEEKNDGQKKAEEWGYNKCSSSFDNNQEINGGRRIGANYEPPNPASVVEEDEPKRKTIKNRKGMGESHDIYPKENQTASSFEPPNPASVVEDTDIYGEKANDRHERYLECGCGYYEPPNPASVVESTKVFIGKRNHQTEKPQDVLEFLIKYWTDEDDVVLDPTMGSGSTGVACQTLNRKFIGFELDPKIYEVAYNRINKIDLKTDTKKNKTKKI